jgi:NAD(P)-dependent dehydrogenase (short-subunit alcohol dehydrogenase family)
VDCNAAGVGATAEWLRKAGRAAVDFAVADLAEPAAIELLAAQVAALATKVDVLVNNAGIELDLPFMQVTAEVFDRVIAVNLRAPLLVSQALAPLFPTGGGAIVNIGSIHSSHAFPNAIPYACSKAGLLALTRNLALELAPRHIRVNAVCPGYIDTPMWDEWLRTAPDPAVLARRSGRRSCGSGLFGQSTVGLGDGHAHRGGWGAYDPRPFLMGEGDESGDQTGPIRTGAAENVYNMRN